MTSNKYMGAVTLIALTMASTTVLAEREYRFPPIEKNNVEAAQAYPSGPKAVSFKKNSIEPELAPPVAPAQVPKATLRQVPTASRQVPVKAVKRYSRPIPPNYRAPSNYRPPSNYRAPYPPAYRAPMAYRGPQSNRAPMAYRNPQAYRGPAPYAARPPYNAPNPYRAPLSYRGPQSNGAPSNYGNMPPPNYRPRPGQGPYGPNSGAPWNRSFGNRSFNNRSFGRNFFDKGPFDNGPFKNGPFGGKSAPWDYDEDDNFGFFDMIPSDDLEEIWDDMIAGPEDGEIPGPMSWPSIEMPGPFEVGEQVEDVMYEVPTFFGDGYGYDSE